MKPTKQKHGKENTIGKIIYGFLLFMPLLAIGVSCAYAIFNKNAYRSYSDVNIEQSINITDIGSYTEGQQYQLNYKQNITTGTNPYNFSYISLTANDLNITQNDYDSLNKWWLNTNGRIYFSNTNQTFIASYIINDKPTIQFNFIGQISQDWLNQFTINRVILTTEKIDNVFYYSIDKVQQNPLFNWANNTATYNVLQDTCNTLGITTTFVPMLLSYWLMISLMYLLYDIALLVVHMAHNRIHDIESSI